ncbi:MAG TPA: MMPL family transporter [Trinickia sp.]|jgi:hopanoid biosynthesis associated RND transporter like protein HpnN|uniref:hopanoid transporter HpnN n=1 Tax=Trinickia sp. TaxID=2571163 RepID=UPI002CD590D7|nr:MMPL family transporter [Trinickia sp.]HTI17613.1 MMPL family transporter [Trinickia sp.]
MLTSFIVRLVDWSVRRPIWVIALALALTTLSGVYVAQHFRINTDVSQLVENEPQWAALGRALDRAFPQRDQTILAVIEAPAPELADAAADALAAGLKSPAYAASIGDVFEPGGGPLFDHDGLLFVSTREVAGTTSQLVSARPLINTLAHDPSLTGLATTLSTMLGLPLQSGQVTLPGLATLFERSADTVDAVLAGKPAAFSWRALVDADAARQPARAFVTVQPVVNYAALQAGAEASDTIRAAAVALDLEKRYGAVVRLTGEQPLADEEFASVEDGAALNGIITLVVVLVILWLALRSMRMIVAVFLTLAVGLPITTALGLMMVGSLNMISVAFMVLFIGLGADFAIQYGVKYREEHFRDSRLDHALVGAAHSMGMPLTLASAAVATSFFSFMPTAYRGVSELGLIAGVGMMVAYLSTLTVLPALLKCLAPPGEASSPGFPRLTPIDDYLQAHRKPILIGTLVVVVGALPLLAHLEFDFNPLHLKDPTTESMSTLLSLKDSPEAGINDVSVLAPSLGGADATAQRLGRLPEVGRVTTLSSFIPGDQPAKLASIAQAAGALLPALTQQTASPSTDTQRVAALKRASGLLQYAAEDYPGPGAAQAKRLAASLAALAAADAASRDRAEAAFSTPLRLALGQLTMLLQPSAITLDTLPRELVRQWLAPNGQALVQVSPHVAPGADPNDDAMLRRFANAVKQAEPAAIGGPISILYSAHVIIKAFVQAAILAVVSITALLWLTLGRFGDVLRTMIPLLVSALVTLELCVVFRMPLNFANIIALPLMLGVGVAFKVYFVMAWRAGKTSLLSSSLTHAVLFSAATTATAFGSLWLSHHPGTASMGRLLALALLCTLVGAVVFQPILMGKPRKAIAQQQELDGIDG